jgi:hypothetical protein
MEGQIDEESLSSTEPERNNATSQAMSSTLRRRMAKRSYPWLPPAGAAVTIPSLSSLLQDDAIPVSKRPRLLEPFPATAEADATKTASTHAEEAVPPAVADEDPMTAMQPDASATSGPHSVSTLENDTELTHEVLEPTVQRKHSSGDEMCRKERAAIAAMAPVLLPLPTSMRLMGWQPSIHRTTAGFTGMWSADQLNILQSRNRVNHGYTASAVALGLGQRESPFWTGWSPRGGACHPSIAQATGITTLTSLMGTRTTDQGNMLETQYNSMNWYTSLALDPGQTTTSQCTNRLHKAVGNPVDQTSGRTGRSTSEEVDIDWTTERKGKWTAEEDDNLLRAAEKFAGTRWKAIAALIPGRTRKQCWNRWQYALDPSIVRTSKRATGKWLTEEDKTLVSAVKKHNGKNWVEIAELVPGRTKRQCMDRWHKFLDTSAY